MPGRIHLRFGRGGRGPRSGMTRVEQDYQREVLEPRRLAGEILEYHYESIKFRLADKTWLEIDWFVLEADGTAVFVDTKGGKRKKNGEPGAWIEADAHVKLKVAADKFPFRFLIAYKVKGTGWIHEEI